MCPYESFPCFLTPLDGLKTLEFGCSLPPLEDAICIHFLLDLLEYWNPGPFLLSVCFLPSVIWRFWLTRILSRKQGMWRCGLHLRLVSPKSAFVSVPIIFLAPYYASSGQCHWWEAIHLSMNRFSDPSQAFSKEHMSLVEGCVYYRYWVQSRPYKWILVTSFTFRCPGPKTSFNELCWPQYIAECVTLLIHSLEFRFFIHRESHVDSCLSSSVLRSLCPVKGQSQPAGITRGTPKCQTDLWISGATCPLDGLLCFPRWAFVQHCFLTGCRTHGTSDLILF